MAKQDTASTPPERSFRFWDLVAVIVGIVVGTAIFKSPTLVFQNSTGPWQALGIWVLGGLLSLCGAFVYAELATTYPRNGGDYEYLSRAYGRWLGFLFGWAQLAAVLSGSIAAMGYAFGDYARPLLHHSEQSSMPLAIAAVGAITVANLIGIQAARWTQNVLAVAKFLGLTLIAVAGIYAAGFIEPEQPAAVVANQTVPSLGLALVFVLYAFGGWNDAAFVAAEVREPRRNIPRALFFGIGAITLIYLAVNAAILATLGFEAARQSRAPAADVMQQAIGPWGASLVSLLVMLSALGAINGMILTGSRVYATIGQDHAMFRLLGRWNHRTGAPVNAIAIQAAVALAMIGVVGSRIGRSGVDRCLEFLGFAPIPWNQFFGGFETLVAATAPVFWGFFFLAGLALVILRLREPYRERPFRVPLYPLPVVLFCGSCAYMLYSSVAYAGWLTLLGLLPMLIILPFYIGTETRSRPK